jgi:hypothetical protein
MSEHLPECLMNLEYAVRVCICTELRVCEKRVLDAIDLPAANVQYQKVGYADGLDAAREAVKKLAKDTWCDSAPCWGAERFLAAIDALRGEQ